MSSIYNTAQVQSTICLAEMVLAKIIINSNWFLCWKFFFFFFISETGFERNLKDLQIADCQQIFVIYFSFAAGYRLRL